MNAPTRVLYRERQRLRAADLQAEQDYLLALAGRHYLYAHDWGVVLGLTVSANGDNVVVEPGLAIDGYGRELLVGERRKIARSNTDRYVYLDYCGSSRDGCGFASPRRWIDSAVVSVSPNSRSIPTEAPPIEEARAAGSVADLPPWPVLIGTTGARSTDDAASRIRFARLRTSVIQSASGRALMRIGQQSLADLYHFCISVRDDQGTTQKRFAIDRDGNPIMWGDLVITGSELTSVVVPISGQLLEIIPRKSAGENISWHTFVATEAGKPTQIFSFTKIASGTQGSVETETFRVPSGSPVDPDELKKFNGTSRLVQLDVPESSAVSSGPILKSAGGDASNKTNSGDDLASAKQPDRPSRFEFQGALVNFEPEAKSTQVEYCGCRAANDAASSLPEGLIFRAGSVPVKPPTRDIQLVAAGKGTDQREELRFSLGPLQDGDLRRRLAAGATADNKFEPWLRVSGNGAVELTNGKVDSSGRPFLMLDVKGTVQLPTLKPDPRDPLFKGLLLLSFINGVLSHGRSSLQVTMSGPAFIETDQPWTYTVSLRNLNVPDVLVNPIGVERLNGGVPSGLVGLPQQPLFLLAPPQTSTITHQPADIPSGAASLSIEILVSVETKTDHRKVSGVAQLAVSEIRQSPTIDLDGLPTTVPPGWAFPTPVKNPSTRSITLVGALRVENLGPQQNLQFANPSLAPGISSSPTSLARIPNDLSGSVTAKFSIDYKWPESASALPLARTKKFKIKKHLTLSVANAAPVANSPWTFDLVLTNATGSSLTLHSVKVSVHLSNAPAPNPTELLTQDVPLSTQHTLAGIQGAPGPSGAKVSVDVQLAYSRLQNDWDPVTESLEILIP